VRAFAEAERELFAACAIRVAARRVRLADPPLDARPRPENHLSDTELRDIAAPVLMIWGDADPYGGPEIGRRAAALHPDARLEVIPGRHAPFLDDAARCGAWIGELPGRAPAAA
jgi:pimeloyl-ACP methyl ester carboxylesterase